MELRREKEAKKSSSASESSQGAFYHVFSPTLETGTSMANRLSSQLAQKTADVERLRKYIMQLEEGEKGVAQELTRQLAAKAEELNRLSVLYSQKDNEHRRLSQSFEGHILSQKENAERIKALLLRKEQENLNRIDQLQNQLQQKEAEIHTLRASPFSKSATEEQKLNREMQQRLQQQIQEMATQISQLKAFITEKDKHAKNLQGAFEASIAAKDAELSRLRQASKRPHTYVQEQLASNDNDNARAIALLRKELEAKDRELEFLNDKLMQKSAASQTRAHHKLELEKIQGELQESSHNEKRLERTLGHEQRMSRESQARLKEQIASMTQQMEELKKFLIEKERLMQDLEIAFEKRIATKEEEARHLKAAISKKPEMHLRGNVEKLESEIQVKEESSKMMAEEIARLKEQSGILKKRLEERQRLYFESEKAYEELISKLREQHEARIRSIVNESSQKEAALRTAMEEERVRLRQEKTLMKEKEKQIEETLQTFNATSQKLIQLGSQADTSPELSEAAALQQQLEEKQKAIEERKAYIESKEAEIKSLLSSTEEKIAELKSKEATIERKEQILLQEQEALNKELDVLSNAGIEISKSKEYLKQKLQQVEVTEQYAKPQPQPKLAPAQPSELPAQTIQAKEQATQNFDFAQPSTGVQEAQEEEDFDKPKFGGALPSQPATVNEAVEETGDFAPASVSKPLLQLKPIEVKAVKRPAIAKIKAKAPKPAIKKGKTKQLPQKARPVVATKKASPQPKLPLKKPATAANVKATQIGSTEADNRSPDQELFTEMGGYTELDEIKSIVEVGMSHGDSVEQIKQSLLSSGYSKANIEKVLSGIKK